MKRIFPATAILLTGVLFTGCEKQCTPAGTCGAGTLLPDSVEQGWTTDLTVWKQQATDEAAKVEVRPEVPETNPDAAATAFPPVPEDVKKAGVLVLGMGSPITVVKYEGARPIPVDNYEVSWEAMKLEGSDFFSALTFPVGNLETCVTFVNGGWGGYVTGITAINGMNASENGSTGSYTFEKGRWYRFSVQVSTVALRGFCNGKELFHIGIKDTQLGMHPSEIRKCMPLGFAAYQTSGAVRHIRIRRLAPGDVMPPPGYE